VADLPLRLSDEVRSALDRGAPVVALESTLITHGLPQPTNIETALAMEAAIRTEGAVPATIGILAGQIIVGLSPDQIEQLARAGSVRKCSRRDLPIALGRRENAVTTVAGTMIIAHLAGIAIFATGGIGGVHRGHPFDVSADLIELGRTPVAVVCSGAKSILDLPLTLEVLETQGVPVIGYGTDTLPAFYVPGSDLPCDVRVESAVEAAAIIMAAHQLRSSGGLLISVPVPAADALSAEEAEAAIAAAVNEADQQGLHGKEVTPYVLSRVAHHTGGRALQANTALLRNNAAVAAQIARSISE
jgi:pseudouridine-5'-phosphate glycosidase